MTVFNNLIKSFFERIDSDSSYCEITNNIFKSLNSQILEQDITPNVFFNLLWPYNYPMARHVTNRWPYTDKLYHYIHSNRVLQSDYVTFHGKKYSFKEKLLEANKKPLTDQGLRCARWSTVNMSIKQGKYSHALPYKYRIETLGFYLQLYNIPGVFTFSPLQHKVVKQNNLLKFKGHKYPHLYTDRDALIDFLGKLITAIGQFVHKKKQIRYISKTPGEIELSEIYVNELRKKVISASEYDPFEIMAEVSKHMYFIGYDMFQSDIKDYFEGLFRKYLDIYKRQVEEFNGKRIHEKNYSFMYMYHERLNPYANPLQIYLNGTLFNYKLKRLSRLKDMVEGFFTPSLPLFKGDILPLSSSGDRQKADHKISYSISNDFKSEDFLMTIGSVYSDDIDKKFATLSLRHGLSDREYLEQCKLIADRLREYRIKMRNYRGVNAGDRYKALTDEAKRLIHLRGIRSDYIPRLRGFYFSTLSNAKKLAKFNENITLHNRVYTKSVILTYDEYIEDSGSKIMDAPDDWFKLSVPIVPMDPVKLCIELSQRDSTENDLLTIYDTMDDFDQTNRCFWYKDMYVVTFTGYKDIERLNIDPLNFYTKPYYNVIRKFLIDSGLYESEAPSSHRDLSSNQEAEKVQIKDYSLAASSDVESTFIPVLMRTYGSELDNRDNSRRYINTQESCVMLAKMYDWDGSKKRPTLDISDGFSLIIGMNRI